MQLRAGYYLPTTIPLLKDEEAAVRLRDLFAVLHALGRSAMRHPDHVSAEHLELICVGVYEPFCTPPLTYVWFLTFAHTSLLFERVLG